MGIILLLVAHAQASADVGTTIISHWADQVVAAWYTAVAYWYALNGW